MATIITKNSQTASAVPSAASLSVGELAVNTADGKLYTEHTGGVVKEIIPSTVVDGGITTAKIADGAVTTAKIAAGAVITEDLANSAVTIAKISASGTPSSSTFLRGDGSWQTPSATLADGSVTDPKIANGVVSGTTWYPFQGAGIIFTSGEGAGGTWRNACQFRMYRGGTFQLRGRLWNGLDTTTGVGFRVLVNSSVVATSSIISLGGYAYTTVTVGSFSVARGQIVQIQNYSDSGNVNTYSGTWQLGTNDSSYAVLFASEVTGNGASSTSNATYLPI